MVENTLGVIIALLDGIIRREDSEDAESCWQAKPPASPGCARMDRLAIGPQVANLPHKVQLNLMAMDGRAASEMIRLLEGHGLEVYVDGGWAVDALLGEQTRVHEDLDIAIRYAQVPELRALLSGRGFVEQARDDSSECNFVLADEQGRQLDVHSYTLDEAGGNTFGVPYVKEHLTGRGSINGYRVRCIAAEWLVKFHTGYETDENDLHDVRLLCARFGIALPEEYVKGGMR
jgi:lincosamide nucleotidyltransferase A/C/D/E